MAWSASNPWADSHGQEEGIQVENENASKRKRRKSCGVPPKSFHRSVHMVGSASSKKTNPSSVQTLLKRAGRSVNYRSFADKYQAFGQQNPFLEFPFQEPAMKALDDLTMKYRKECENNNKHHDDDDDSEDNHDDAVDDPMWSSEPRIFAVEKSSAGKRRYIVATLGRFLHHYWRFREPSVRHFYELIREKEPCRLYFDIEYNVKANPSITQDTNEPLMDEFITELQAEIRAVYGISIDRTNIVDLDSSTAKKFSRHLIVHLPGGELFADAVSCGLFAKNFVGRLAEEEATSLLKDKRPVLAKYLFVHSKPPFVTTATPSEACSEVMEFNEPQSSVTVEGDTGNVSNSPQRKGSPQNGQHTHTICNKTCFIDTGVYTRNRLFRILGSSKYGKAPSAALRIASANQFPFPEGFTNAKFYVPSIQNTRKDDDEGLSVDDGDEFDWKTHGLGLVQTLVTPAAVLSKHGPQLVAKLLQVVDQDQRLNNPGQKKSTTISRQSSVDISRSNGPAGKRSSQKYSYGPSPFTPLDSFVTKFLANRKGVNGAIRAWSITKENSDTPTDDDLSQVNIIYQIKDNRWCENIQRCHKSNNVMWHVSIRDMKYWQSCWDPECRMLSFRGVVNDLPRDIQKKITDICTDKAMQIDDDFENELATLELPKAASSGTRKHNSVVAKNNESVSLKTESNCNDEKTDPEFDEALIHAMDAHPELFP